MNNSILNKIMGRIIAFILIMVVPACGEPMPAANSAASPPPATVTQFIFPPTYTPTESGPLTATPTPRATRTPSPTETAAPTLKPSPTPLFEIRLATADDLPFISASLLYVSDREVRIWDFLTLESRPLDPELPRTSSELAFSQGGYVVVGGAQVANGFEVWAYNRLLESRFYSETVEGDQLLALSISPDGSRLALTVLTAEEMPEGTPTETPESSPTPGEEQEAPTPSPSPIPTQDTRKAKTETILYFVNLFAGDAPVEVADCSGECSPVIWSPFSNAFYWGDHAGFWQADVEGGSRMRPERLLDPFLTGVSGSGQQNDSYFPLQISPSGRLAVVRKGLAGGSILSIVNLETGASVNLPGTGEYTGSKTGFTWTFGDGLLIARPGVARLELLPAIELWGVDLTVEPMAFILLGRYIISDRYDVVPDDPVQLPDGRIGYTVNSFRDASDPAVNGLFLMNPSTGDSFQTNYLPLLQAETVRWLPDGLGVLLLSPSRLLFVPVGFGQIYSMNTFLDSDPCCLEWLP